MLFEDYTLILGSKSPRRKLLLEGLGFKVEVHTKEVHEEYPETLLLKDVPIYLAIQKADAFNQKELSQNEILITADTVVVLDDTILGKPKDENHAFQMLSALSGRTHQVITGVCLKSNRKQQAFSASTNVHFRNLDTEEIAYYIHKYKPFDKAGSYGIQEWIGYVAVEYIEGSYFNVMGLPTQMLYKKLKEFLVEHTKK